MSKVSKVKESCGYQEKPVFPTCSNCGSFVSERDLPDWMANRNREVGANHFTIEQHGVEKNTRCLAHGFATKKTAMCSFWRPKVTDQNVFTGF